MPARMLLLCAAVIIAANVAIITAIADKLTVCDCGGKDASVRMTVIHTDLPLNFEVDYSVTYTICVSKPVSRDIVLNYTSHVTFRCDNGTVFLRTDFCTEENPLNCIRFIEGDCKPSALLFPKECGNTLNPGEYKITMSFEGIDFPCKIVSGYYEVSIRADDEEVGCFTVTPPFMECRKGICAPWWPFSRTLN